MTKQEVIHFMQKIKAYYDYFQMEDYKINEWYDKLKKYDLEDVYRKFDQHLNGELKDSPPKLHYITRYLLTPEEKAKDRNDYLIECNLCGRTMTLSRYNNDHYDRCSSINYLLRNFKKKNMNVSREELESLSNEKFNDIYEEYKKD